MVFATLMDRQIRPFQSRPLVLHELLVYFLVLFNSSSIEVLELLWDLFRVSVWITEPSSHIGVAAPSGLGGHMPFSWWIFLISELGPWVLIFQSFLSLLKMFFAFSLFSMPVHAWICICVHMHVYMHVCAFVYAFVYAYYVYLHMYLHVYICVYMHIVYIFMCMYICSCMCICLCIVYAYIYAYMDLVSPWPPSLWLWLLL